MTTRSEDNELSRQSVLRRTATDAGFGAAVLGESIPVDVPCGTPGTIDAFEGGGWQGIPTSINPTRGTACP